MKTSKRSYCRHYLAFILPSLGMMVQPTYALTLNVSADTAINKSMPTQNNGAARNIIVRNQPGTLEGYARFDLSALPKDAQINQAMLRIWVNKVVTPGSINLHEVTGNWDEKTLTAANMPTVDKPVASLPIAATAKNSYVLVDITGVVKGWQGGSPNFGIALRPDAAIPVNFLIDTKEGISSSHPMEIEVSLEGLPGAKGDKGDTGATGPQGLQGAQGPIGPVGGQGPSFQGPTGPRGLQGSVGPIGISGYEVVMKKVFVSMSSGTTETHVPCPNNKKPLAATVKNKSGSNLYDAVAHGPDNPVGIIIPIIATIAHGWVFYIKNGELEPSEYVLEVTCVTANIPGYTDVTPLP